MKSLLRTAFMLMLMVGLASFSAVGALAAEPTRGDISGAIANECAPEDGPIVYTGFAQFTPNKTGNTNILAKVSGVSANGTLYQISQTVRATSSPDGSFSQRSRIHLVSQGSSDNQFAYFTFSYDASSGTFNFDSETACRG